MSALARKGFVPKAEYGSRWGPGPSGCESRPVSQDSGLSCRKGRSRSIESRISLTGRQEPLLRPIESRISKQSGKLTNGVRTIQDCVTQKSLTQKARSQCSQQSSCGSSTRPRRFAWEEPASKKEAVEKEANCRRAKRQNHPMAGFRASKAQMFQVFAVLDKDMSGKVTPSEFEDDCFSLGMSPEQVSKLWKRIDWSEKGYIEYEDWGRAETLPTIEKFTRLYMMTHMGLPTLASSPDQVRKYNERANAQKVRNVVEALEQLRRKVVQWGSRSSGDNPIFEAFKFVDADRNGVLSVDEFCEAFGALGVNVADETLRQILSMVDMNGDGSIDYYEFSKSLFPRL
ncbi:hypothetical protein BSKO_05278 [Bryopsis sp. KO-2023]|nr:hypothetical protein BSKO_05278 [Bryopsis sp. KO-2023]